MDNGNKVYDLIGDIHGCADSLEALLKTMGYREHSGCYSHPESEVIFLGDYIDRGPKQARTIEIVRRMVESGNAHAIMGNHEFNAIAYYTPDPSDDGYLRQRNERHTKQHRSFLNEFSDKPDAWRDIIDWLRTLPLWLDFGGIRAVHACWDPVSMACLQPSLERAQQLDDQLLVAACDSEQPEFEAIETLLKGKELPLPEGHFYFDKEGTRRHRIRVRWWDKQVETFREAYMGPEESRSTIPEDRVDAGYLLEYSPDQPPLFFGHYWLSGLPTPLATNIACLDYSIAKPGGALTAYRWRGEQVLLSERFVSVTRLEG